MIRHLPYFETLGSLGENSDGWRRVFAGLVVLRLADIVLDADAGDTTDAATFHSVREAIHSLSDGDSSKPILAALVDELARTNKNSERVCELLNSYGRSLDMDGRWHLACDVFQTVSEKVEATSQAAIDANILLGGSARRAGNWEVSAAGYASAAHAAAVIGDTARSLKAEVGMANTHLAHGNLPAADEILETVVADARENELPEVLELALHNRSTVAHNSGRYSDAIDFAYEALSLAPAGIERDGVLADMAASFAELGMRDAARDAHMIVNVTSQSSTLVAQSAINLMELASLDGMEDAFDRYASELSRMTLEVRHRAYYLLYQGQGQQRFGRLDAAATTLEAARQFATANGINQIAFEADESLARLARDWATWPTNVAAAPTKSPPATALHIARELTQMRELALSGS